MRRTAIIAVLTVTAWMFTVVVHDSGARGGTGQEGEGGQAPKHPTPEQMAKSWVEKFDANKDSELSQGELTKAVEGLQQQRAKGAGGSADASQGGRGGAHQGPPPADKVASKMIEKFSFDKKGLTEAELVKAFEEHLANRGHHAGGGQHGGGQPSTGSGQ